MILPHEHDGFASRNQDLTNSPAAPPSSSDVIETAAPWQVHCAITAVIEVARADAATPEEAAQFAKQLAADLPLKVSIGGVPLPAAFKK